MPASPAAFGEEPAIDTVNHILSEYSTWIGVFLFVIVFIESLILVGYMVPAATVLLAAGALAGAGYVDLTPALVGGILGGALGGSVNFWLGARFRPHVPRLWPYNRNPELLEHNLAFVSRHGGKGVLLGRFAKPLRPAVPALAGMLEMERGRFMTYNMLGATLWAPVYLYGGFIMGTSASFATTSPLQLSTIILLATGLIWGSYLLARRLSASRRQLDELRPSERRADGD